MTAWNSIRQDQLTRESQITWILPLHLVKRKKKQFYTKSTGDRTAVIHMYERFSVGCWSSPSQPAFLFSCGLNLHRPLLAGLCARSLTCSSGFVWKSSCSYTYRLRLNQSLATCRLSYPPPLFTAGEQNDMSLIHHPRAPWPTRQPFWSQKTHCQFSLPKLDPRFPDLTHTNKKQIKKASK